MLRDAQIKEDAVVKTLIFKENVNTPDNMTDGASSLPPKDNNRNGSSVSITITENSTSGENYKSGESENDNSGEDPFRQQAIRQKRAFSISISRMLRKLHQSYCRECLHFL